LSQQFKPIPERTSSPVQENNEAGVNSSNFEASSTLEEKSSETGAALQRKTGRRFDWLALGIVVSIAAIFTLAARVQPQPSTSFVPAVVLSATGFGLLITALRKLRSKRGLGLGEAAVAGLIIALFQWIIALTYPGVISSLSNVQLAGPGFFTTWGLVALSTVLFSMVGTVLGYMAFPPLRPLPDNAATSQITPGGEAGDEQVQSDTEPEEGEAQEERAETQTPSATRPAFSYAVAILMLGLAPILVGYVFAASFDFSIGHFGYDPGPFSTLRLLSTLLSWQIPVPITLSGASGAATVITLLWRIPLFFGNPSLFDIQALEPFVFNGAGLALLLVASRNEERASGTSWGRLLFLEALLGLLLVVPADLWIMQGLQGVLQIQSTALPIGTLHILNVPIFALNLLTAPLTCMLAGALIIRFRPASSTPTTQPADQ
jgi:hypothetical protein